MKQSREPSLQFRITKKDQGNGYVASLESSPTCLWKTDSKKQNFETQNLWIGLDWSEKKKLWKPTQKIQSLSKKSIK